MELMYFTAEHTNWHTVMSPLGVWSLLSGLSLGAGGQSRAQLRLGLYLPVKDESFIQDYKNLMINVTKSKGNDVTLKIRNYIFTDSDVTINANYKNYFINNFNGKASTLQFKTPQQAADQANDIIRKSITNGHNVFESKDFMNTKMVVTNVITFEGRWRIPFDQSETQEVPFYDEDGKEIGKVNMMHQEGNFPYLNIRQISATVLELPYGDDDRYSFLAILPYEGVKLSEVYQNFVKVSIKDILNELHQVISDYGESEVIVNLPRIQISTNVMLSEPLQNMKITDIFDSGVNSFGPISPSELFVSAVVHKAEITVTEVGTVASASSSAYFSNRAQPSIFNPNRPFFYFIVEKSTGTFIFGGAYSKPTVF